MVGVVEGFLGLLVVGVAEGFCGYGDGDSCDGGGVGDPSWIHETALVEIQ